MAEQTPQAPVNEKTSHLFRNVFLCGLLLTLLFVGGCSDSTGDDDDEADKTVDEPTSQESDTNDPIDITGKEGEAFTLGDIDYLAGWTLQDNALGDAIVADLKATNNSDDNESLSIQFRFWRDTEVLSIISCSLVDEIPAGATGTLDCASEHSVPTLHNKMTVQNSLSG